MLVEAAKEVAAMQAISKQTTAKQATVKQATVNHATIKSATAKQARILVSQQIPMKRSFNVLTNCEIRSVSYQIKLNP